MSDTVVKTTTVPLSRLLEKVYHNGGHDFRDYKISTITRRLERRLQSTGARNYPEYISFLNTHPEEYERLVQYLTITVSGFFRNQYAFEQMTNRVLPEFINQKTKRHDGRLRFWSTACARGEEPYSIAIMLAETLKDGLKDFDIRIHATDINRQAIKEARIGFYSDQDIDGLPDERYQGYFIRNNEGLVIKPDIRRLVSFSYFDLVSGAEPPFAEMDVIFCCNILIYLQRKLQERVLNTLYNMLAPSGYLVLGEVETPPENLKHKLKCLDTKAKIYQKI